MIVDVAASASVTARHPPTRRVLEIFRRMRKVFPNPLPSAVADTARAVTAVPNPVPPEVAALAPHFTTLRNMLPLDVHDIGRVLAAAASQGDGPLGAPIRDQSRAVLRAGEAARYLNISLKTLERLHAKGEGPHRVHLGPRMIGYRREALDAWLREREAAGAREGARRAEGGAP